MKAKIFLKDQLSKFIDELIKDNIVFAPKKKNDFFIFDQVTASEEVSLDYLNSKIPPKAVFFPQSEVMFRYEKTNNGIVIFEPEAPAKNQIIFGMRPCDARSFLLLDKFLAAGKFQDTYYGRRRKNTSFIGLACNRPMSTCLCTSVGGSPYGEEGMDVLLTDLGDKYLVKSLNIRGDQLIESIQWLQDANEKDLLDAAENAKKALASMEKEIPLDDIDQRLDACFADEDFWRDYSLKCIGCGTCTFVCPTCHCFDVIDEPATDGSKGARIRLWDTCQFPLFTLHGSGHNPRPIGYARMRHRLMHKFNYYPKVLQEIGCVGCGRCIFSCPVNLDFRTVLKSKQET